MSDNFVTETTSSTAQIEVFSEDSELSQPTCTQRLLNTPELEPETTPSVLFSDLQVENISVKERISMDTHGFGRVPNTFMIPCLYKYNQDGQEMLDTLMIKGCEMSSRKGIQRVRYAPNRVSNQYSLIGNISNNIPQHVHFKEVVDDCIGQLSVFAECDLQSSFAAFEDGHYMPFKLLSGTKPTNFYDANGKLLQWHTIMEVPIRFIPTFSISKVYLSPFAQKACISLREAIITHVDDILYTPPRNSKHSLSERERQLIDRNNRESTPKNVEAAVTLAFQGCTLL